MISQWNLLYFIVYVAQCFGFTALALHKHRKEENMCIWRDIKLMEWAVE